MSKPIPHGSVSVASIEDAQTKRVTMKLNENIVALSKVIEDLLKRVDAMEKR